MKKYIKHKNYVIGITDKDERFYIDKEDLIKIRQYNWYKTDRGYMIAYINGIKIYMHRLILGLKNIGKNEVDHINHIVYDNTKKNLRICTHAQNMKNRKNVTGVYKNKKGYWIPQIVVNGQRKPLGCYNNYDDAKKARTEAEKQYFGEYRCKV